MQQTRDPRAAALIVAASVAGCFAVDWDYKAATEAGTGGAAGAATTASSGGAGGSSSTGGAGGGCPPGFGDCDGDAMNGCETPFEADILNCGACGRVCSEANAITTPTCEDGSCRASCALGWGDCQAPLPPAPDDGCESQLDVDDACGGCGNACSMIGLSCDVTAGDDIECECVSNADCGVNGSCNPNGECLCSGVHCADSEVCEDDGNGNSVCLCPGVGKCADGFNCCVNPPGCADLTSDPQNCGACGRTCPTGWSCVTNVCSPP